MRCRKALPGSVAHFEMKAVILGTSWAMVEGIAECELVS